MPARVPLADHTPDQLDALYDRLESAEAAVQRAERYAAELARGTRPVMPQRIARTLRLRLAAERGAPIQGPGYTPAQLLGADTEETAR